MNEIRIKWSKLVILEAFIDALLDNHESRDGDDRDQ